MQTGLRALLKAHFTSLPAQANADDFAALLASISSIPSTLQVQFVAPLLQDVAVSASPALDQLCVSATALSDSAVASMATVIAKGALSQGAVAQLADKLRTGANDTISCGFFFFLLFFLPSVCSCSQ